MTTSSAEEHRRVCPVCKDKIARDHKGRGFCRHTKKRGCPFERGQRDKP